MRSITKGLPRQPRNGARHAALPYTDVADFLVKLRSKETLGRLALEFVILTAARSGEVRKAEWSEFNLKKRLWTIPGERMKSRREHVVPLGSAAVRLLERCAALKKGGPLARVPVIEARSSLVRHDADQGPSGHEGWCNRSRIQINVPRLGQRSDRPSRRVGRGRTGTCYQRQDGGRLPPRHAS